ncbi:UDP-Glc:alpha-D-GlcNAc-diphosphoundecaprenol beta-1,3-glucosyltransferase WfgD [compost metagenome]
MISVCMATYNGESYIKEQIQSILPQLKDGDELIVSDDGSTDNTLEIVFSFESLKIRVLQGPQNGLIKNFENAINAAKGDYIFLCDQDDIWLENKVDVFKVAFDNGANLIVSDCRVVDANAKIINESFFSLRNSRLGFLPNLLRNGFLGCCMAFKAELKPKILPFPKNIPMHDWWIGLVASLYGEVVFINQPLILYRRHGNNASPTGDKSSFSLITQAAHRLSLCFYLMKGYLK